MAGFELRLFKHWGAWSKEVSSVVSLETSAGQRRFEVVYSQASYLAAV